MLFIILVIGVIALSIWGGIKIAKDEGKSEGIGGGITILLLGSLATLLITFAIGGMSADAAGRTLLKTEAFTVAEGSMFENKYGEVRFIEQTEDKTLVPHRQDYSELKYETTNIKKVEVQTFSVNHYNVTPWGWGDAHVVTLK